MAGTGVQLRDIAVTKRGYRYEVGPTRTTGVDGYFDCSGLTTYAMRRLGINPPTISWLQARWCRDNNTLVSVEKALATPGALLFEGPDNAYDGFLTHGHVVISMGNNHDVIEARGHAYGVLVDSAIGRPWTNAALVPGLSYAAPTPPPVIVHPDFPDTVFRSITTFQHERYGACSAAVTPSGAVYVFPAYAYSGAVNGKQYWGNRVVANIRAAHAVAGHGEFGYVITDEQGEHYGPNFDLAK